MENKIITEIELEVLNILDNKGEYRETISEINTEDQEWREKSKFLSILTYCEIVDSDFDEDTREFIHAVKSNVKASEQFYKIDPELLEEAITEMDEMLFKNFSNEDDELVSDEVKLIRDQIIQELDEYEEYSLSAIPDKNDEEWLDKMEFLTMLVSNQMLDFFFCRDCMEFHYEIGERSCDIHNKVDDKLLESEYIN